jgi:hypothetical protein
MSDTKAQRTANSTNESASEGSAASAETLYQRLGDKWYASSLIDDEVFVGSISTQEINENDGQPHEIRAVRISGNS